MHRALALGSFFCIVLGLAAAAPARADAGQQQDCVRRIAQMLGVAQNVVRPMESPPAASGEIVVSTPSGPATCWVDQAAPAQAPKVDRASDLVAAAEPDAAAICAAHVADSLGLPSAAIRAVSTQRAAGGVLRVALDTPFGAADCSIDASHTVRSARLPGQR